VVFSIVDVVEALTDSTDSKDYWYRIKKREKVSGFQLSTICRQLKLESADGKKYLSDCASSENFKQLTEKKPRRLK
jgi:hypothetical protein